MPLPQGPFNVVLADPPWKFKVWSEKGNGRAPPYPTMALDDIKAMPVKQIAAKNCLLVMWTTAPFLEVSLDVMKAWGFKYSTAGAWAKLDSNGDPAIGTGFRWRSSAEFWIAGKRGNPRRSEGLAIPNCILAPLMEHSRKPGRLHEDLDAMFPGEPKCELFARQERENWTVWGNETTRFGGSE